MEQQLRMTERCRKRFEPVVDRVKELLETNKDCIIVAIDGMSASGKSTLGFYLKELFDCNLFHMDDFFLQEQQRTQKRLNEIGGNVDYERFKEEVLLPLLDKKSVSYRAFSCKTKMLGEVQEVSFRRLNIVEGSYSQHPYFSELYESDRLCVCRVFMELSSQLQTERIRKRNGEIMLERFLTEWIPKENVYFETFGIKQQSERIISID